MPKKQLDFTSYQREAFKADQVKDGADAMIVPLLGLAGEVGSLLVEHKKSLRDKERHRLFKEKIEEDLGDILWYVANVATKTNLDLEALARKNLRKVRGRWIKPAPGQQLLLDVTSKPKEQLPRHFAVEFKTEGEKLRLYRDGKRIGDPLTDNVRVADGYRYHDVFHFAYAAVLGWSPVSRALLKCKRRSDRDVDRNEDGGRAIVTEEGISQLVYQEAKRRKMFRAATHVDGDILRTIRNMASDFEVSVRTMGDWERAILIGFDVWNSLHENGGGIVTVDLNKGTMFYASLSKASSLPRAKRLQGRPVPKPAGSAPTRYQRVAGGRSGPR
jgi:NTP pyrophosphatase (non-canonical NTP hydrolase)